MLLEQPRGGIGFQAGEHELGRPWHREDATFLGADAEEHGDRVGLEPPRSEDDRIRGRCIEPLGIIHEHEQRLLLRCGSQQAERRGADEEATPGLTTVERERAP